MLTTKLLRTGDRVLTVPGGLTHPLAVRRAVQPGQEGAEVREVAYTVPVTERIRRQYARRDVHFTDGALTTALTTAHWISEEK